MLVTAWEPGGGPGGGGPSSFGTRHRLCQLVTKIKDPDPGVKWNWDGWGTGEMSRRRTRVDGAPAGAEIPLAACRSAGDRGARYLLRVPRALLWSLLEILVPWGNPRVFRVGGGRGRWEASGGVLAEPGKPVRLSGCLAPVSHLTLLLGLGRLQRTRLGDFQLQVAIQEAPAPRSGPRLGPRSLWWSGLPLRSRGHPAAVGLGFVCLWLSASWRGQVGHSWVPSSGPGVNTP